MTVHDEREPWERWKLTPYVPDPFPEPPVALCTPSLPAHEAPQVAAYGEIGGFVSCDARMTYTAKRERGKFGTRSPKQHTSNCPRKAVVSVLYTDGSVTNRCKEHTP